MKHPVVPGADDIIVPECPLAQWPAGMIATTGDCPELAITVGEGNGGMVDFELLQIASFQIFDGPQPLPVLICLMHHLNLLWPAGSSSCPTHSAANRARIAIQIGN